MSQSDDLSKLFLRFGGTTDTYQEIVREDAVSQARERWPLLAAVRVGRASAVQPVRPGEQAAQDNVALPLAVWAPPSAVPADAMSATPEAATAGTELSRLLARLEGGPTSASTRPRTRGRHAFLDRLARS